MLIVLELTRLKWETDNAKLLTLQKSNSTITSIARDFVPQVRKSYVYKDGTVLQINEVSEPLLHNLGVDGEKLPAYIEDFVQRVISLISPEKM